MMDIKRIGFIGTGIMGSHMAMHLMDKGYELTVFNRTVDKTRTLTEKGARLAHSVSECVCGQDAVITIIGYPKDVEEVYLGEGGVTENAKQGTLIIDMTTSAPSLAVKIYEKAKDKGLYALDAPVTGGDTGAKAGTLTILAGGDKEAFDMALPLFEAMGKNIVYTGKAGNGQHVKMCNQIAIAGALSGAAEAISYARAAGIDEKAMVEAIATGAAGSFQLSNVAKKGMNGDFAPGFMMKHFVKDMGLADEEAVRNGIKLPVLENVLDICRRLEGAGCAEEGTQSILKFYE